MSGIRKKIVINLSRLSTQGRRRILRLSYYRVSNRFYEDLLANVVLKLIRNEHACARFAKAVVSCISSDVDRKRMTTERDLIERAQKGDADAFELLLTQYQGMIYRTAARLARNSAEAQDITQEALLKIARSIKGFAFRSQFSTWLYRVTVNVAYDYARSMRRNQVTKREVSEHIQLLESESESQARSTSIRAALQRLSEKERTAVVLCYFEGLSHAEIAQVLQCAETTVSWHIFMAKRKLKSLLTEES